MLVDPNLKPHPHPHWADDLRTGDIVEFRFPHRHPAEDEKEPKLRPCLVLDVVREGKSRTFIELVYGTSSPKHKCVRHVLSVSGKQARKARLHRKTRFETDRRVVVTPRNHGFALTDPGDTPVIGRLAGPELQMMLNHKARIFALRDMVSERVRRRRQRHNKIAAVQSQPCARTTKGDVQ